MPFADVTISSEQVGLVKFLAKESGVRVRKIVKKKGQTVLRLSHGDSFLIAKLRRAIQPTAVGADILAEGAEVSDATMTV